MKRLMSGTLLLGAVLGAASCSNVTSDLAGGPTSITVDHNPLVIGKHKVGLVVVQNLDDQGSPLLSAATAGTPTGPISVEVDTAFQHAGTHYGTQFKVTGTDFGVGLVTFTDGGLTTPLDTVLVLPNDTNAVGTLSTTTPAPGDTMTMVVSGQFRLDGAGLLTIDGFEIDSAGLHPKHTSVLTQVSISADSQTVTFLAPDTIFTTATGDHIVHFNAPVSMTATHYQYSPAFPFGLLGTFAVQSSASLVVP